MIDISCIGKDGLIIHYDDIISLIGFNLIRYLRTKEMNKKAERMSLEDILLSYINRENEDPKIWLKEKFDVDFDIDEWKDSINIFQPNWLYSYKVFDAAYKNGMKKLMIYSENDIPIIKKILLSYNVPIEYVCGDIVEIMNKNPNATLLTSSSQILNKCLETEVPFAVTIVDDFLHLAPAVINNIGDKLKERNKYVCYTSIRNSGWINLDG